MKYIYPKIFLNLISDKFSLRLPYIYALFMRGPSSILFILHVLWSLSPFFGVLCVKCKYLCKMRKREHNPELEPGYLKILLKCPGWERTEWAKRLGGKRGIPALRDSCEIWVPPHMLTGMMATVAMLTKGSKELFTAAWAKGFMALYHSNPHKNFT